MKLQIHLFKCSKENTSGSGADPEILKRGGTLCRLPWLADEENFRF